MRACVRGKRTRLRRRRLIFIRNRWVQNLSANNTSLLIFLDFAGCPQGIYHKPPWILPRPQIGWFEVMLGDNSQSRYWKEHFRIRKDTFLRLVALVAPEISRRNTRLRKALSTPKRVAIALWRLARGGSFRDVATQFDMGKSTCVKKTREFCHALNRLSRHFIKFLVTCRETTITIALFQDECKIPQAVGAIDGTHFEIDAPENPFGYFDRQHRHSAIMQAVDGENLVFPDTAILAVCTTPVC